VKRLLVFFIFPLLFACQIPTAVEIRGTPELHFSEKMNMGSMFAEQLEKGFQSSEFKLTPCANTSTYTYIVHNDLFNNVIDLEHPPEGGKFSTAVLNNPLLEDTDLINSAESKNIPFANFGDLLHGFTFHNAKTYLFVSGKKEFIEKFWLGIKINDDSEEEIEIKKLIETNGNKHSGFPWTNGYISTSAPSGGYLVPLPLNGGDVSVEYRVYAKKDEVFTEDDFETANIRVELVVWLPLEFAAGPDGAEIEFPAAFMGEGDLFGRQSPEDKSTASEIIESLNMTIKFDINPFIGEDLIILIGDTELRREEIKTNSLNILFDEENLSAINDPENWQPFIPVYRVAFNYGDTLRISKLFNTTELIIIAKIRYRMDLDDFTGKKDEPDEATEPDETTETTETEETDETDETD